MNRRDHESTGGILGADRGLEWHRAMAPGVKVGEITTHGLALSRPRRGFESRWGHQIFPELRREDVGSPLKSTQAQASLMCSAQKAIRSCSKIRRAAARCSSA